MEKIELEWKERIKEFTYLQLPENYCRHSPGNGTGSVKVNGNQERMLYRSRKDEIILQIISYQATKAERKVFKLIDKIDRSVDQAAFVAYSLFIMFGYDPVKDEQKEAV